jgi:hypothetical protein
MAHELREHRPPTRSPFIECIWIASGPAPAATAFESVLPDGCPEWIFHLAAPYQALRADGTAAVQSASLVVGQMTRPLRIAPTGPVRTMGIRFRPGGAHPFFDFPLDALTGGSAPTRDVWSGGEGRRVEDAVFNAPDDGARRALLEDFLASRLDARGSTAAGSPPPPGPCCGGTDACASRSSRGARLESAAARARVPAPRRRLAEDPRAHRPFQNLLRLSGRDAARAGRTSRPRAATPTRHLVREFREFAGVTPTQRPAADGDLARHFVEPDRLEALLQPGRPDVAFLQDGGRSRS